MKTVDEKLKKKIDGLAKKYFEKVKEVNITLFNINVLTKNGIDYKDYVSVGKSRLVRFLKMFPETLIIIEKNMNNGPVQYYCRLKSLDWIAEILTELIKKNGGKYLLSNISQTLETEYGIDYKTISEGRNLQIWLKTEFADKFVIDGYNLILKSDSVSDPVSDPVSDLNVSPLPEEVSQMHSMAFMSWWVNNAKTLQRYTGQTLTNEEWSSLVAHNLARALLGEAPLFSYTVEQYTKFVFNIGIKTKNGNSLLCVLKPNPNNKSGDLQPYAMDGFCCIAEDDSELCNEVKQNVPDIFKYDNILDEKYEELQKDLEIILTYQDGLGLALPEISEKIAEGTFFSEKLFNLIKGYYDKWSHIQELIDYLGWNNDEEPITISSLVSRLENSNRKSDVLNKAVDMFVAFAEAVSSYCKNNLLEKMSVIIDKDIEIAKKATLNQYSKLTDILVYYTKLMEITSYDSLTDDLAESIMFINGHFDSVLTMNIFKLTFYKKTDADLGIISKSIPDDVFKLLSNLKSNTSEEEKHEEVIIDSEELLKQAINSSTAESMVQIILNIKNICTTKLEKAVAACDFNKCRALISGGEAEAFSLKSSEELSSIIDKLESGSTALTLYECGRRVYELLGNSNQTAEKFFIAGLITNSVDCSRALIDLYTSENEPDNFYSVWVRYGHKLSLSLENTKYLMYTLCCKGEDVIRQYLKKNVYYFYDLKYSAILSEVLEKFNYSDILDICKKCALYISSISEINNFEKQILEMGDNSEAKSVIGYINSFKPLIESYGYTDDELENILSILSTYESSEEQLTSISRLYEIQGNKNATVEKLIWETIRDNPQPTNIMILLKIMTDEERYDEACALFECYEDKLIMNSEARELFIIALTKTNNARFYAFLRDNMQDCLNLFACKRLSEEDFNNIKTASSAENEEDVLLLCKKTVELAEYLDDFVLKTIIIISDDLRDLVLNTEKLIDFGLDAEQVENFVSVFKTDSFSRSRDVLGIAERLYALVGSCDVTKDFALFAMECHFEAISLLLKIYTDTNDVDSKLELFSRYPESRAGREREYYYLLLIKEKYEQFLSETQQFNLENKEVAVQTVTAKCRLSKDFSEELSFLKSGINDVSAQSIEQMLCAMAEAELFSEIKEFITDHFDEMLSVYSASEVERFVTVSGKLPSDELKALQKDAIANDFQKLAIYIYETLGTGRLKGASKKFFDEALGKCSSSDEETQKQIQDYLRIIYAKNEEYALKIVLNEITSILSKNEDKGEMCAKIEHAIEGVALAPEGALALMNLLKSYELPITLNLFEIIVRMCKNGNIENECIEFFNSLPSFDVLQNNVDVLYSLCELYRETIKNDSFDEKWIDNLIDICAKLVDTKYFYIAEYCTYLAEKRLGNNEFSKYNLYDLLNNIHEVTEDLTPEIEAEAENMQITDETRAFDLFVEMADASDLNAIMDYCKYCSNFIHDKKALLEYYKENIENIENSAAETLPADACEIMLKLLYSSPENGEYWCQCANMPLTEYPGVYAKILYKASLLNNKESIWKKCINACERHSQEDLLMDVLIDCASNIPLPYGMHNFRTIMAEKVNTNPLYFSASDNTRLTELISIICDRMKLDYNIISNHSALRDLSIVALATNSAEALSIMLDYAENSIFAENSNVGFAIACRLILAKRVSEAKPIIEKLSSVASVKYKNLISKLAAMSVDELSVWGTDKVNVQLLNMALPDGNYPDIQKINEFALTYSTSDNAEAGAMLICELLDNLPNDYGCYMALFILSKQLPQRIEVLHKALCGLVENRPQGNSNTYYTRNRKDYAIMLASIDALIMSLQLNEQVAAFDGYDFTKPTWEYYKKFEGDVEDVSALNEIQNAYEKIQNIMMNQSAESCKTIYNLVFGYVTGNWSEFLRRCWETKTDLNQYLEQFADFDNGMIRSVLYTVYSLADNEQDNFITWIEKNNAVARNNKLYTAVNIYKQNYYKRIPLGIFEGNILKLPFEENSVFGSVFNNTVSQVISKAPANAYPCALLVGYLACSNNAMNEFWQRAMALFNASNDAIANILFATMNEIFRKERVYHGQVNNPYKPGEMYESMMRITGVFSENESIIKSVSKPDFNPWSCINMVFALLYTHRANEVSRLKKYFSGEQQHLTDIILTIINKNVSDFDKLNAIGSLSDEISQGMLYYIIRYCDPINRQHVFLNESDSVIKANDELERIALRNPLMFNRKLQPTHYIWAEPAKINKNAYEQLETVSEKRNYEIVEVSAAEEVEESEKLSIVSALEPLTSSDKSIEELWEEHENIHSFGLDNYQHRVSISKMIYQLALGNDSDDKLLIDYAIRYGVDYYYYCMAKKDYSSANSIVLEMVNAFDPASTLEGARMLKNTVCNTALHELLHRGYSTIRVMVEDYVKNKQAFIKMRNMLPVSTMSLELNDVNCIYTALEIIAKCINETSASHTSAYKSALLKAGDQLKSARSQGYRAWSNLRNSVFQMILDEVNRIDQRANLTVEVTSKISHTSFGYIYGEVKNMGNERADNIRMQFSYNNGSESSIYELSRLGKGETAAFEVKYSAKPGTKSLDYEIIVSYGSKGEKYNYISNDTLKIEEEEFKEFPTGLYLTDRPISDFTLLADGTIGSENFYGREEEKKKINAVFMQKGFVNYKNVIIKGIRRSGKTSVLNYLLKYANLKCDDVIAILIDCSGIKGDSSPIQHMLVDSVIRECRMENVANLSDDEWNAFAQKWKLPEGMQDCNADDLQYLYRELKALNDNKGLMLIIDEFDILIEAVEKNQGVYSTLLPSLRVLLNSSYCQEAIHLVVCGSTKLIRYMDGGTLNQLFQQFGDNVIEIGRLLAKDMNVMLTDPYKDYPEVRITDAALKWIWQYTSGLVWYSKLVASFALERAISLKRSVVFPSDVINAVTTITGNDEFFKNLMDSCFPNEIKILDAIQSMTAKATEYVTINDLLKLLSDDFSQREIENIVNTLEKMQILQRNPFDRYSYRFAVELYWHYFRVSPSNYERCAEIPLLFKESKTQSNYQFDDDFFDD